MIGGAHTHIDTHTHSFAGFYSQVMDIGFGGCLSEAAPEADQNTTSKTSDTSAAQWDRPSADLFLQVQSVL